MTKDSPLISIIIPMYNAEKYIGETIQSVMLQSYKNWEMIIVNNASTDKSLQIIDSLQDSRISVVSLDKNSGGPAKPRNIGIENANGEYIAFLDADDIWHQDKLKIQIDYMIKYNYTFTSTNQLHIDENSIQISNKIYKILAVFKKNKLKKTICDLIKTKFISTSSVIVKKEYIDFFDEDKDLVSVEDLCLWLKLFNNKNVNYSYLDKKLLFYRVLENSISSRKNTHQQNVKANICILKFILRNNEYDIVDCFYSSITNNKYVSLLKKSIKNF